MISYLKTFAMALVAISMLSIVLASAASATAFNFKFETVPSSVTGRQHAGDDQIVLDAGKVECTEATYAGEQKVTPTTEVSLTPTYTGCTAFGFANTPVHANGCRYRFTVITKENGNFEGAMDIVCPDNSVIEVTAPGCDVTIPAQTGLKKVTYTNIGSGSTREVTIDIAVTGLKYEEHNTGIFPTCPTNTVQKSNGTYNGANIQTAENPTTKAHHGLWVE